MSEVKRLTASYKCMPLPEAYVYEDDKGDLMYYADHLTLQRERDELKRITGRYRKCEKCGYQFLIQPAHSVAPCPKCKIDDLQAIVDKLPRGMSLMDSSPCPNCGKMVDWQEEDKILHEQEVADEAKD